MKKGRQSPDRHASEMKVGTRMRGRDGNLWIVVEHHKIHRWNKFVPKINKKYKICLTNLFEPTFIYLDESGRKLIEKRPKMVKRNQRDKAFIFGKKYPVDDYSLLSTYYDEHGIMMILDATSLKDKEYNKFSESLNRYIYGSHDTKSHNIHFFPKDNVEKMKKNFSERILQFLPVNEVDELILVHVKNGKVDSLVIDCGYFVKSIYDKKNDVFYYK